MPTKDGKETREYAGWAPLAGYFDGDGSVIVRKLSRGIPFTLNIALEFTDQSIRQIRMVQSFLGSRAVKTGKVSLSKGAWRIEIGTLEGVRRVLAGMLPHLCKKYAESRAVVDYLDGKITGNELQDILQDAVKIGDRERLGRRVDLPWTRFEGLLEAASYASSLAGRKPSLDGDEEKRIVFDYVNSGLSQREIARARNLSRDLVRSILFRYGVVSPRKGSESGAGVTNPPAPPG